MTDEDPKGPMQGPRTSRDAMKTPAKPLRDSDTPEDPATDDATSAVEDDQEVA